jgi:hypothetical protein
MAFIDAPDFETGTEKKDGAHPRFYMDTRQNLAKSEKEGRPIFDDIEMVEILIPGDRLNSPHQLVGEAHRKRWPRQYAGFRAGLEGHVDGTPIDQLPGITKGVIEELRHFHVLTIEQLAGMPDELLMKAQPMMGRSLREKAERWIASTTGSVIEEKLAAENRTLKDSMEAMKAQMAEMQQGMAVLQAQAQAAGAQLPHTTAEG